MLRIRASAELFVKIEGCVSFLTQLEMILDTSSWVYTNVLQVESWPSLECYFLRPFILVYTFYELNLSRR
jgi:hypothetical protein